MASQNYNSLLFDMATAKINFETDDFYGMLVTSAYAPNVDTHKKRSDVTNEVVGTGYTAGGQEIVVGLTEDAANDRLAITLGDVVWPSSTITARAMVIYQRTGAGAASDRLIAYGDFGADKSSSAGDFEAKFTAPLLIVNVAP